MVPSFRQRSLVVPFALTVLRSPCPSDLLRKQPPTRYRVGAARKDAGFGLFLESQRFDRAHRGTAANTCFASLRWAGVDSCAC